MLGESLQDFARRKRLPIEKAYAEWHAVGRVRGTLDRRELSLVAAFNSPETAGRPNVVARVAAHFYLPTEER